MISRLVAFLRKVMNMLKLDQVTKAADNIDVLISEPMQKAIDLYSKIYTNDAPWLTAEIRSLNLGASIAGEIARVATVEMEVRCEGSPRAEYLAAQYKKVGDRMRENIEQGSAKGGLIFKPFPAANGSIAVDCVQADSFFPTEFNADKKMSGCIFVDVKVQDGFYFTRLEIHQLGEFAVEDSEEPVKGYRILNKVFKSETADNIGREVELSEVKEWADLEPEGIIANVTQPLFGYFRYPLANNVDDKSPLGVSCFARAVAFIEQADKHWEQTRWEYNSAERRLYVDALAFSKDSAGNPILPDPRLYRTLEHSGEVSEEDMFHEWSPDIRVDDYDKGLEAIFRKIEFASGMDYGRLSNPQTIDKTATEIESSQQRFYTTITDVQKAIQEAVDELFYAMDIWTSVDGLAPEGEYNLTYLFDDSIITDTQTKFNQDSAAVGMGTLSKVEWRMRQYKEDEETAKKKINEIMTQRKADAELEFGAGE